MSYNISKELFKEITGNDETINEHNKECIINGNTEEYISFNDFYFMCKEWAYSQGYIIYSSTKSCSMFKKEAQLYCSNENIQEQQKIFDACQWILDNKEK